MEFDDDYTGEDTLDDFAEDADLEALTDEATDEAMDEQPDLSDEELEALLTPADQRDYMQTELVDTIRNPDYIPQLSLRTDPETGEALLDENGFFVECPWNTKGAQRPDGMLVDDTGIHLREVKNYGDLNHLMHNIRDQTENRETAFGEGVDLTYVVAPRFTVEEADKLCDYVENTLGQNLEWQHK